LAQYDVNLREYWWILKKRKFIVAVITVALGVFSTGFAILKSPTPLYTSSCKIEFKKDTTIEGLYAKTISWSGADDIETQISIIGSYRVFEKVAEQLGLIPHKDIKKDSQLKYSIAGIVENLQSKLEVEREEFTNILDIKVTDINPVFAQKLANAIALTYKEMHAEQQMKRTTEALKYIDDQLKEEREKLRQAEDEFNRYSQDNQLISVDLQSEHLLTRSQEIQDEIRNLHEDKRELEGRLPQLNQFIGNPSGSGHDFSSMRANTQYQTTNDDLVGLLLKRDTLLEDYTPQHPEVVAIGRKIIEIARKMVILLQLQIRSMDRKEINLKNELKSFDRKTNTLMNKKLEFDRLKRNVKLHNDMTALLEKKNQEALIKQAEKPEEITIVKPALLPAYPINPPKTATTGAMGAIIGLILGLVIAFIVETFDTSLGAIEDVEETLGTQVLGIIPQADDTDIQEDIKDKYPEGIEGFSQTRINYLISHFVPKSMIAESFRALRTNIQFKDTEKKTKTIAVVSTTTEEGKTLVIINLAITMAQAGMKILLVGSDLRKPMIGRAFGVDMAPGITDILLGTYPWRDTVKTITDMIMGKMTPDEVMMTPGLDNLHIITSGTIPPNPTELIDSSRLMDFIEETKKEYDMLLFDSSPILSTADAALLGAKVDGVLLVYRVGKVPRGLLKRSTTQLEQVKCNIMGVILNGMRTDVSPDFPDYKRYRYQYGEENEEKESRGYKRAFSFLKKEKNGHRRLERKTSLSKEGKKPQEEQRKKPNMLRLFLMLIAIALLAVGMLWQYGIMEPLKLLDQERPVKKDEIRTFVKKRIPTTAIPRKPEAISKEPKSAVFIKKTGSDGEASISKSRPVPYSLYLGSFRTRKRAEKAISLYSEKGLSPYWAEVELSKGIWYRVFTGHFEDSEQAENFRQEHGLTEAIAKKVQYANLIGIYTPSDELEEKTLLLKDLGYSPYLIEDHVGKSRLFVGAFSTKQPAEKLQYVLKSNGIRSQVVKR